MAAARTLLRERLVRRSELAFGVIGTPVERVALARAFLYQIAIRAERTLYADEILLHVLALGITTARGEFSIAPVADHHVPSALGAGFVEGNVRDFFALIQTPRGLAVGISRTRHELPEASALQHHHPAAVFAVFLLRGFLHVGGVKVGQIDGIFFRESTTVGIFLVVRTASVERAVLAPLDHQR